MRLTIILMTIFFLLTACHTNTEEHQFSSNKDNLKHVLLGSKDANNCPDAIIDYVDALMWNDIMYHYIAEADIEHKKGAVLGETTYTLLNNACMDYKMKHGDATFLPVGTKVYEADGYKSTFRVIAGGKLYQVDFNPSAKTVADIYDIQGKVTQISLESIVDGNQISVFTEEATKQFIDEWLALEYAGFEKIKNSGVSLGNDDKLFLRIHLNDNTSFRIVYWTKGNILTRDTFGTDSLRQLVLNQRPHL